MKNLIILIFCCIATTNLIAQEKPDLNKSSEIIDIKEELPRFPGCEDIDGTMADKKKCADQKLLEYVYSNLQYPAEAKKAKIEGRSIVRFTIDTDGSVIDIEVVRDLGGGTAKTSMAVIEQMNKDGLKWTPGVQYGKKVKVMYTLPIVYKL